MNNNAANGEDTCVNVQVLLLVLLVTAVTLAIKQLSGFRCRRGLLTCPNLLLIDLYSLRHLRDVLTKLSL